MPRSSSASRRCGRRRSCWAEIEPPTCMGPGRRRCWVGFLARRVSVKGQPVRAGAPVQPRIGCTGALTSSLVGRDELDGVFGVDWVAEAGTLAVLVQHERVDRDDVAVVDHRPARVTKAGCRPSRRAPVRGCSNSECSSHPSGSCRG